MTTVTEPERSDPAADDASEVREWLTELLPKAAHKKIDAIVEGIVAMQLGTVGVVEVHGARVAVDEVDAFGLHIQVDANGNATTVTFPYGAFAVDAD